jgi:hypothetical protein
VLDSRRTRGRSKQTDTFLEQAEKNKRIDGKSVKTKGRRGKIAAKKRLISLAS